MIGIIDSGIGGKGIEREIKKLLPDATIKYLADTKNFPYGTKPVKLLHQILLANIECLRNRGAKIIVLACNSATVSSVNYLRREVSIPIVGVVPAIKSAAQISKTKRIAIFATPITSKSKMQDDLIKKYCSDCQIYKIPFKDLARQIETGDIIAAKKNIAQKWQEYQDKNIDTIVLGCTHYTLIKGEIQKIVGSRVKLVDSNRAVAKQVKKIYDENNE